MGIVAESNVPNILLQLNVMDRGITYRGMLKVVPDNYWNDEVKPKLYPLWDTEKDRLVEFSWYDNNTYHCIRRKFIKNFKTNEYEWKDYEIEQTDVDAARSFYEFLKETFLNIEQLINAEFQEEMGRMYGEVSSESWLSIRLARNFLLQETDFVFACSDVNISEEKKENYALYRQKLRDLPNLFADVPPNEVKFPMSPEAFTAIYKENHPGEEYLSSEDQWITLGSFFFTSFREKMVRYLTVRDVTDRLYTHAFIEAMRETPVRLEGTAWSVTHQNMDSIKQSLDKLLEQMDLDQDGGEQS
jgi:hypothetical protein